jgi:hypothetical protein
MDAGERQGFEGDGFSYLKNPIWWGGIIACMLAFKSLVELMLMASTSNHRRDRELCRIRVCTCDSGNPPWGVKRLDRRRVRGIFSEGRAGYTGEAGVRYMPDRLSHHRPSCPSGQGDLDDRRDLALRYPTW